MTRRLTAGAVTVIAVLAAGVLVATSGIALVVTVGSSMQPRISAGDLVITRPAPSYRVGDSAAYVSPLLGTVVLHRIVGIQGDTFVFQGDNNSWLDPETPRRDQLVGKEWLHIPRGGVWLRRITSLPALAAFVFLLISSGGATAMRRRHRRGRDRRIMATTNSTRTLRMQHGTWRRTFLRPVVVSVALLAAGAVVLGTIAWTRPTRETTTATEDVTSKVAFSYSATVPLSPAYDGTTVTPPQPVFRKLTQSIDVTFVYRGVPATVTVDALLSTAGGWSSTLRLAEPTTFGTDTYRGTVTVDLRRLQQRAEAAAKVTGIPAGNISVAVVPTFAIGEETFAPELDFVLDPLALRLAEPSNPDGADTDPLVAQHSIPVTSTGEHQAQLQAFGRSLPISTLRLLSAIALAVAVLLGLAVALLARGGRPLSESDRINVRYAQHLLPVSPMVLAPGRPIIDVPTVDALVKLAERYGLLVLHWSRADVETYVVQDEGTTYRYRANTTAEPLAQKQPLPV